MNANVRWIKYFDSFTGKAVRAPWHRMAYPEDRHITLCGQHVERKNIEYEYKEVGVYDAPECKQCLLTLDCDRWTDYDHMPQHSRDYVGYVFSTLAPFVNTVAWYTNRQKRELRQFKDGFKHPNVNSHFTYTYNGEPICDAELPVATGYTVVYRHARRVTCTECRALLVDAYKSLRCATVQNGLWRRLKSMYPQPEPINSWLESAKLNYGLPYAVCLLGGICRANRQSKYEERCKPLADGEVLKLQTFKTVVVREVQDA